MLVAVIFALAMQSDMTVPASAMVDGRPNASEASRIQQLVDTATPGSTIEIPPGIYEGDLIIDRPLHIRGRGRPVLLGSRGGSVVRVRAADVTIESIDIDGRGGGDLGRDASGIHVAAPRVSIRDCHITNALFGVYLREAEGSTVQGCRIRGIPGKDAGEKGSGIHIWNTGRFSIIGNDIREVRDGIYIQSSSGGRIVGNTAADLRYGIHYMFSDDNTFEDNRFENGAAGAALMNSKGITFRRNQFVHNRGFASVGLLLKSCDDVLAEKNLIADNARGIFVEGSYRDRFIDNVIAESDTALVLYDSVSQNVFEGNSFVANLTPLSLVGRRTDTRFDGNYWSDNRELDLDGDGYTDRPYRLSSVFDHLRGNLTAADLFTQGVAAQALGAAEQSFPVLEPLPVEDRRPLARPPAGTLGTGTNRPRGFRTVDAAGASRLRQGGQVSRAIAGNPAGLTLSLVLLLSGAVVVRRHRRREVTR